jgi:hypothetical protein
VTDVTPKPRRGCFFYGCITGVVLLVMVLGALLTGLHYVKKLVNSFTDTQPIELPTVQMSQAEIDKLKQRFETFQQEIREGRLTKPLTLTADDINALIASGAEWKTLKGKFYIRTEGDQLKGDVSVPLQEVGLAMFKGRYLNGRATFDLVFSNGALVVTPRNILVRGKPLPEVYMQEIRKQNLAVGLTNQPAAVAVLKGLQDIRVEAGNLVIVPKKEIQ